MKLTNILQEIKIENPTSQIRLTDEGKQAYQDIGNIENLLYKYCNEFSFHEVFRERYQTDKLIDADLLRIFIDEKAIFKDKPTSLEHYRKRVSEFWDTNIEVQNGYLKGFIENKFIHPLKY